MKRTLLLCMILLVVGGGVSLSVWIYRTRDLGPQKISPPDWSTYLTRVTTGDLPPGDNPDFWPATPASRTGRIPMKQTGDSEVCGQSGCHPDIVRQWQQSMHHMASFTNPFYRKSVEYTRERQGDAGVRWCAGCHDPVLLFAGKIDGPVTEKTPGADAGITCVVCHSMVDVQDLSGNGRYVLDVPDTSFLRPESPLRGLTGVLLKVFPRPHKHGFLKPLHRQAEFCSSCHRVGLALPQNHYRWLRGQDQFGGWLNGGASGRVARSFYTPKASQRCQDCHMPLTPSHDAGNHDGFVHSHSFPGANTAVPPLLGYPQQAQLSAAFLAGSVRVDLLAAREVAPSEQVKDTRWFLPLEQSRLHPGHEVRIDAVVRNLRVGHGFPEGVLDNKDIWLEMSVVDQEGHPLWQDCPLTEAGLPRSAHIYGAILLDAAGQRINKRNINDFRNVLFRRTLGPGQSDLVRYRFRVPMGVSALTFQARLRYRKVQPFYARWTYAGRRAPGQDAPPVGAPVDTSRFEFDPSVPVPEVPVVDVAMDRVTIPVGEGDDAGAPAGPMKPVPLPERLYDYGIGFVLQQDFPSARYIFDRLLMEDPRSTQGLFGLVRTALAEGDDGSAAIALNRLFALLDKGPVKDPAAYPRALAFRGQALLNQGNYDDALRSFQDALRTYPQDRSLYVDLGFTYFQQEKFDQAIAAYKQALALDPDDLSSHSTLARIYQLVGKTDEAQREQRIFEGMREDISLDGSREKYLEMHPDDALEVVNGHEHMLDGTCGP